MRSPSKHRSIHRNLVIAFAFCTAALVTTCAAQQSKIKQIRASSDHPVWRVDLQSLGYPANSADLQRRRGFADFDTISFISDNIVVATFITRESIPALQRRDDPNRTRPYRLHAVFLETLTGKVLRTLDWPIDDPNAGIFPRYDGGFLLVTSDGIFSFSADWNQLKEVSMSDLHPATAAVGGIAESPSARLLVIQFLAGDSALCLRIRTDTLDSTSIPCGAFEVFTASDSEVVTPEKLPSGNESREKQPGVAYVQYGVSMPDAAPSSAAVGTLNPHQDRSARTICNPCVGMPQFINKDVIAMYSASYVKVVGRSGKVMFAQNYEPRSKWIDEFGRPVRASANGQRFAIASNRPPAGRPDQRPRDNESGTGVDATVSGHQVTVISGNAQSRLVAISPFAIHMSIGDLPAEFPLEVEIYDLQAAQWIYTLQINSEHIRQIWGLALSPNAQKLAIDSGGAIQLFSLPPFAPKLN